MKMIKYVLLLLISSSSWAYVSWHHTQEIYVKLLIANNMSISQTLVLVQDSEANASSGLTSIKVNSGMLSFVRNDDEMAMVLGHEIAHWRLGHRRSTPSNEYAADWQGAGYMAKTGYNICKGAKVLARFGDTASKTHPAGVKRYRRLCK